MKEINGCVQEVMDIKPDSEAALDEGRTPTPQPVSNSTGTPVPPVDPALEFSLVIKPKGTPIFRLSAVYKSRLQVCICLHFVCFLVMLAKLSEDILDRLDFFVLQLEEMNIPKPLVWEYLWCLSIIFAVIGLKAISKNSLNSMNSCAAGILAFGIGPLFGAVIYFFSDITEYVDKKSEANIETWQGYPIAFYVYVFAVISLQVHFFTIYFAAKLIKIWKGKAKKH